MQEKNRQKEPPSFANINLLAHCNIDCYFCLGKDLINHFSGHNCLTTEYEHWPNFIEFLNICIRDGIKKIYLTGQNTDPLMYGSLESLIKFLQNDCGFNVGIRTNAYNAIANMDNINLCNEEIGYTINSLDYNINHKITGVYEIPDWNYIIPRTEPPCRVSIVINRYNIIEIMNIIKFVSKFDNVKYIQLRRVSTDTRQDELLKDMQTFDDLFNMFIKCFGHQLKGDFKKAEKFYLFNKEITFWRTISTSINSYNYYTDGVYTDEYFIIEGYLKNYKKFKKE